MSNITTTYIMDDATTPVTDLLPYINISISWTSPDANATTLPMTPDSTEGPSIDPTSERDLLKWHGLEIIYFLSMIILAVFGNSIVIYIYHSRWRQSNFSFFIKLLSVLDLTNACTTIPLLLAISLDDAHPRFDSICQGASFIAIMTAMASGVVLVIIAVDRNRRICQPLKRELSMRLTRKLCIMAIVFGVILAIPSVFVYGKKITPFEDDGVRVYIAQCYFADDMNGTPLYWTFISSLTLVFTAVMTCLAVLYMSMYRALRVHLARRESMGSNKGRRSSTSGGQFRAHRTSAKIFFTLTVAFFSCYFPYFIAVTILMAESDTLVLNPTLKMLADIAKNAPLMSNAINPIIYSISSQRFRKEILDICQCTPLGRSPSQRARLRIVRLHVQSNSSSTGGSLPANTRSTAQSESKPPSKQ